MVRKYIFYTILIFGILHVITIIIGQYTSTHWSEMAFFVGGFSLFFSYLFSSSGDGFTGRSEARTMAASMYTYTPTKTQFHFSITPFFVASLLFLLYSFAIPYAF